MNMKIKVRREEDKKVGTERDGAIVRKEEVTEGKTI